MSTYGERPERVEKIILVACEQFGVDRSELLEGSRLKRTAHARAECCRRLRDQRFSLAAIGRYLNIDHSTVHRAIFGRLGQTADGAVRVPDLSGEWAI